MQLAELMRLAALAQDDSGTVMLDSSGNVVDAPNVNIASPTGGIISVGPAVQDVTAASAPPPSPAPTSDPVTTAQMDSVVTSAASSSTDVLGNVNLTQLISSLSAGYVAVSKAVNAPAAPTPGTIKQLPGGARIVTNADGSTTVTSANGVSQTVLPSGQVVAGGASLLSSPIMLVALGVGALLLLRMLR